MGPATDTVARERDLNSLAVLTVVVVLATVTMTFGAMIAAFLIRSQSPLLWGHISLPPILWLTTAILLASSITFEVARRRLRHNEQREFFRFTAWTTALGLLFLAGQIAAGLQILNTRVILVRNPHTWFIFLFTGLHALHILIGLGGLAYLLVRTREPASGPKYQMNTRVIANGVSIFWHYLDFLWIVLFSLLLTWRR
jgi:cytochrome c oxidase subunit III